MPKTTKIWKCPYCYLIINAQGKGGHLFAKHYVRSVPKRIERIFLKFDKKLTLVTTGEGQIYIAATGDPLDTSDFKQDEIFTQNPKEATRYIAPCPGCGSGTINSDLLYQRIGNTGKESKEKLCKNCRKKFLLNNGIIPGD